LLISTRYASINTILDAVVVYTKIACSGGNYGKFIGSIGSRGLLDKALLFCIRRCYSCGVLSRLQVGSGVLCIEHACALSWRPPSLLGGIERSEILSGAKLMPRVIVQEAGLLYK
jgi:hypothetical protein